MTEATVPTEIIILYANVRILANTLLASINALLERFTAKQELKQHLNRQRASLKQLVDFLDTPTNVTAQERQILKDAAYDDSAVLFHICCSLLAIAPDKIDKYLTELDVFTCNFALTNNDLKNGTHKEFIQAREDF